MSYDFIYIYRYISMHKLTNRHKQKTKKTHMPRGRTEVSQTLQCVMHKLKFQVVEYTQTSYKCRYKKYRQDDS